ncbi:MAG: YkgJ family cysteine cluster protein [Armatimonadetes bacterium]|nr:YkgJ family cysteine cluster protein [Armatimonadota bacterium]
MDQPVADPPEQPRPATLDVIITDQDIVERRANDLADQTMRFRAWVKCECLMPDDELDALVAATARHMAGVIDCRKCGRCCTLPSIGVNEADCARLARRLGMSQAAFGRKYVSVYEAEEGITGPCPFLKELSCTVYEDRPDTCRGFPYLEAPGFRQRMLMLLSASFYCPLVFNTLEALKRRLPWRNKRRRGR